MDASDLPLPLRFRVGEWLDAEARAAADWPLDSRSWYEVTDGWRSDAVMGQGEAVGYMAWLNRRDGENGVVWTAYRLVSVWDVCDRCRYSEGPVRWLAGGIERIRASMLCPPCYERTLPFTSRGG